MIIYLVASYYLPHNIIHAGKWCDALRMVIKEGYTHAGFDVNVETFDLDGDDDIVDEDEDVEDYNIRHKTLSSRSGRQGDATCATIGRIET